jgi:2-keto-4-pentenoate hydratase/2-oxohepta-3-ene-1,7-dioic acid hydratase in catechol pathway
MKLVTFREGRVRAAGYVDGDDAVVCVEGAAADHAILDVVRGGEAAVDAWRASGQRRVRLSDVTLEAPIPVPLRDIWCVGKNYYDHASEFHASGFDSSSKTEVPSAPVIFTKATTSVCGPGANVLASIDPTASVDYEGELAVVIGKKAFRVSKDDAMDYVFGYMNLNDVTSRELQKRHGQWIIGKSLDTFCPTGPWLVTADEVGDVSALDLVTEVNGEVRQRARVADLIFDIPTLIETMSRTMTLLPGDVIATGTPSGVGIGYKPPKYLAAGDTMRVRISRLGILENRVA